MLLSPSLGKPRPRQGITAVEGAKDTDLVEISSSLKQQQQST